MNYNIAGDPEDSPAAIDAVFGEALHAPRRYLIARTRKGRTEYYQSLGTNWSPTTWTERREAATGFATDSGAEEFRTTFRLGGRVVENDAR